MPEYLPHGVAREDFQAALAEIRKIVGAAWVFSDPASLPAPGSESPYAPIFSPPKICGR